MRHALLIKLAEDYISMAEHALSRVAAGAPYDREALQAKGYYLLNSMGKYTAGQRAATDAAKAAAYARRESELFTLHWRDTGHTEEILGWDECARRMGYAKSSLRIYLSQGKGRFVTTKLNPQTDLGDTCTLTRVSYVPGKMGRPKLAEAEE